MFDDFDDSEQESDDLFDSNDLEESLMKFESLKNDESVFFTEEEIEDLSFHFLIYGQYENQMLILEYGLNIYPNKVNFLIDKAGVLTYKNEFQQALEIVRMAKNIEPYNAYVLKTEGEILTFMEEHDEAKLSFESAMKYSEMEDEVFKVDLGLNYAQILSYKNQYNQAIQVIEQLLSEFPENELLIHNLGEIFTAKGNVEESIEYFKSKIDLYPFSDHYWNQLGKFYELNNDLELSLKSYEYATLANQDSKISFLNLGNAYESLNKFEKAIECYQQAFKSEYDEFPYLCIARCYLAMGNSDLTRHYLNKAKSLEEVYPEYNYLLGYSYLYDQNAKKALPYFKLVYKTDNEDFAALKGIFSCYYEMEEMEHFTELYEESIINNKNLLFNNWKDVLALLYISELDEHFNEFINSKEVFIKNQNEISGVMLCIKYDQEPSKINKDSIISRLITDKEDTLESVRLFCGELLEDDTFQKTLEFYNNQHEQ